MEEKKISKNEANKLFKKDVKKEIKETKDVRTTENKENDQSKDGDLKMPSKEEETEVDLLPCGHLSIRLDNLIIDYRSPTSQAIFNVEGEVQMYFVEYLRENKFLIIFVPSNIVGASEDDDSLFGLVYIDPEPCLAQSQQCYKQMVIAGTWDRVYVIGPVYRAENRNKHRQFNGLDMEMRIKHDYHEVIDMICNAMFYVFDKLAANNADDIATVHKQYPATPFEYIKPALVLEFCEAVVMLRAAGVEMGDHEDLSTANKKQLGHLVKQKYATDFFVLDKFPLALRPFYTMPDDDNPGYSNSYDMFMRGEEIMSGAQRIHDATQLRDSAIASGIDPSIIYSYLNSFTSALPPHGGGCILLESLVMLYLGLPDIRLTYHFLRNPMGRVVSSTPCNGTF